MTCRLVIQETNNHYPRHRCTFCCSFLVFVTKHNLLNKSSSQLLSITGSTRPSDGLCALCRPGSALDDVLGGISYLTASNDPVMRAHVTAAQTKCGTGLVGSDFWTVPLRHAPRRRELVKVVPSTSLVGRCGTAHCLKAFCGLPMLIVQIKAL